MHKKILRKGVFTYDYMDEDWEKKYQILNIFVAV